MPEVSPKRKETNMSGECENCGEHCIDCKCLGNCITPPAEIPETKWINVHGREEHEALIKNVKKCRELGLDQIYETIVYLKRWGCWMR